MSEAGYLASKSLNINIYSNIYIDEIKMNFIDWHA